MAKRATRRLALGGVTTGNRLVPRGPNTTAQVLYLKAVERLVPTALTELASMHAAGALGAWCEQYRFTEPWLRRVAENTATLLQTGGWRDGFVFTATGMEATASYLPDPPRWDPAFQSREDYHATIDRYLDESTAIMKGRGWSDAPEKRNPEHFDWLARYQVGGASLADVAALYDDAAGPGAPDVSAVSRALTETAALVGITLRNAPGRTLRQTRRG